MCTPRQHRQPAWGLISITWLAANPTSHQIYRWNFVDGRPRVRRRYAANLLNLPNQLHVVFLLFSLPNGRSTPVAKNSKARQPVVNIVPVARTREMFKQETTTSVLGYLLIRRDMQCQLLTWVHGPSIILVCYQILVVSFHCIIELWATQEKRSSFSFDSRKMQTIMTPGQKKSRTDYLWWNFLSTSFSERQEVWRVAATQSIKSIKVSWCW